MRLYLVALLASLVSITALSKERHATPHTEHFIDVGGARGPHEVMSLNDKDWKEIKNSYFGGSPDPIWLRIRTTDLNISSGVVLNFADSYHSDVRLYYNNAASFIEKKSGIAIDPSQRDIQSRFVAFRLKQDVNRSEYIFIKMTSNQLISSDFSIVPERDFEDDYLYRDTLILISFYTFWIMLLLSNLCVAVITKDKTSIKYCIFIFFSGGTIGALDGVLDYLLWFEHSFGWQYHLNALVSLLAISFLSYTSEFLGLNTKSRTSPFFWIRFVLLSHLVLNFTPLSVYIVSLRNNVLGLLTILILVSTWRKAKITDVERLFVRASILIYLFCSSWAIFSTESLIPRMEISHFILHVGSVLELTFMCIALGLRIQAISNEKIDKTIKLNAVKVVLGKAMSSERVNSILANRFAVSFLPRKENLSVMFLDMDRYSLLVERCEEDGTDAYCFVIDYLNEIKDIINRYGGVVNKVMGDGIMCFFGYDVGGPTMQDHAVQTIACAAQIQKLAMDKIIHSQEDQPLLPLRIGIDTRPTWLLDMDGRGVPDISVYGRGVIFAARMETACSKYNICISESTYQEARSLLEKRKMVTVPKFIKIKHGSSFIKVFEIDVFRDSLGMVEEANRKHNTFLRLLQREERELVANSLLVMCVQLNEEVIKFKIIDFSISGFRIIGDVYIGESSKVSVSVEGLGIKQNDTLHINPFEVEVKWGRLSTDDDKGIRFVHGVKISSLNDHQKQILHQLLQSELQSNATPMPKAL